MPQDDHDRLVTLKESEKEADHAARGSRGAEGELRQVQRLLEALRQRGDKAAIHGLRGKASNRKIEENIEQEAIRILSLPVYQGFGPTLAAEYLRNRHGIEASKETVRQWMMRAKLLRGKKAKVEPEFEARYRFHLVSACRKNVASK